MHLTYHRLLILVKCAVEQSGLQVSTRIHLLCRLEQDVSSPVLVLLYWTDAHSQEGSSCEGSADKYQEQNHQYLQKRKYSVWYKPVMPAIVSPTVACVVNNGFLTVTYLCKTSALHAVM